MKLIFTLLLLFSLPLGAVPENEVRSRWYTEIIPHFEEMDSGSFINRRGMRVHYYQRTHPENKKVLVILPGRTEASLYYSELIYDLRDEGFDIFIIDHQGQGQSDRLLLDRHKGHVFNFYDYVDDLTQFTNEILRPETFGKPLYLLSHSMGGAIATLYLSRHPFVFKKAVLNSPMMQINTEPFTESEARRYAFFLMSLRRATYYPPGMGPFNPDELIFETNEQTHSKARYNSIKSLLDFYPDQALGDPTVRWVFEALRVTQKIDKLAPKIQTPLLIIQAGLDQTVRPDRQNKFCQSSPQCRISHYPKSYHQPLLEVDSIRNRVINEMKSFFRH